MTTRRSEGMTHTVYADMVGDTDEGRFVSAGLYRSQDGDLWARIDGSFEVAPQVYAILTDPRRPARVTIGTQIAIFRSDNHGDTWPRLTAPAPELAAWSLARHPTARDIIYAGYAPPAAFRSNNDGETGEKLPVSASSPDVTAGSEMPKRITAIAVRAANSHEIYASLEIGGLLGSYCCAIAYVPDRPATLYLGAGNDFDGDKGALFISDDDGATWYTADLPGPLKSSIFAVAINPRLPTKCIVRPKMGVSSHLWVAVALGITQLSRAVRAMSSRSRSADGFRLWQISSRKS
jgi:hypothetical protein